MSEHEWLSIANELAEALGSFMGYDGYGQGGSDDANRGDWRAAEAAMDRFNKAVMKGGD
jgi:hypothetical protein